MTNLSLGLQANHYENMKNGIKIYEGRLNDEKRQEFIIGDTIKILKDPLREEFFYVKLINKLFFDSFTNMVEKVSLEKLGFKDKTKQEVVDIYHEFYSEEKEEKYGVVVFVIELI